MLRSVCRRLIGALLVTGCVLGLAGCALVPGPSTVSKTATVPPITHNEVPTPPGPDESAPGSVTAAVALSRFASEYINWDAANLKSRLEMLAGDSVGEARSAMVLEASQTATDPELAQAGIANQGTVEAVAPLGGGDGRYVVVTRETTTATNSGAYQGLAPAWHLTLATVAHRADGWVVSGWQPEN